MSDYIVYPNGFVGSGSVETYKKPAELSEMHMKVGLFKTRLNGTKEQECCKVTEVLYNKYFGKQMDMAVIIELMRLAYKHIGDSPLLWLKRHNDTVYKKSGSINKYHVEFLCETIDFAAYGQPRKISINSWYKYLTYGNDDSSIGSSAAYKRIVASDSFARMNVFDFIVNWINMPNGQQDMLMSLKLMYGQSIQN